MPPRAGGGTPTLLRLCPFVLPSQQEVQPHVQGILGYLHLIQPLAGPAVPVPLSGTMSIVLAWKAQVLALPLKKKPKKQNPAHIESVFFSLLPLLPTIFSK